MDKYKDAIEFQIQLHNKDLEKLTDAIHDDNVSKPEEKQLQSRLRETNYCLTVLKSLLEE